MTAATTTDASAATPTRPDLMEITAAAVMDVEPLRRPGRWRIRASVLPLVLGCGLGTSTPTFLDSASPVALYGQARAEPLPAEHAPASLAVVVQPIRASTPLAGQS